ncbi:MAG: vanadium-dependent haloperoxidase [Flavobacteriaceae bacterium]|nr:vanadium-dependent haloperoxidase [Flavobacteriaceae bacterium]
MKLYHNKTLSILACMALIFNACTTDDDPVIGDSDVTEPETINLADSTAKLIVQWSDLFVTIDQHTIDMRPNSVTRSLAYIHLTGYETAVPFMDTYNSNAQRFNELSIDADVFETDINLEIALNEAYGETLSHFMFSIAGFAHTTISEFRNEKLETYSQGLSEDVIERSRRWGRHVARRVIAYSETDEAGEDQIRNPTPADYIAPVGEGLWAAGENEDAWFPYWREVRTFAIGPEATSTTPFTSLFSYSTKADSAYYTSMTAVYETATAAATDNAEELWIAEFWADDVEGLMISPPGRQFSIANQLIAQYELGYERTLELLLRLGFALNDAAVSAWDDKYTYNTQRPSTYINETIDKEFTTNLARFVVAPNPAFPSYPSGHATFAGAASGVFIAFFETDNIAFTDNTYLGFDYVTEFNGTPRSFDSFTEMAYENAYSRVPLGVHILEDSTEGLRLGYEIAEAVNGLELSN